MNSEKQSTNLQMTLREVNSVGEGQKNVPKLRFKGYEDAWEQRRLEEIFLKIRNAFVGTSTPYYVEKNQGGYFYIESNNVKHGKINHDTEVFINEEFYQNQKDKWLKTGDIVMVQSGHVGHSAVIPEYLNNSAAHALIMFQEYKIETNPYFINFQFQTESVRNKIDSITTGNTIKHILASDMKLFSISSTQKKEADKLGDFFISLDNLITLHQRKYDALKSMKKTLLSKMFPKNGEDVPEIRFKEYTDAWEQRRLADVSVLNPKGEIPTTFKYVDLESVLGTSLLGYKIESKESAPSRAQRVAKKGDIFYQTVRPYQKNNYYFCLEEEDYVFSTGYAQIRPNCSGLFLFTYLQLDGFVLTVLNNCTGTSYPAINSKVLSDLNIRIPQILEQEKIGDIFHSLENLITLHQRKLEELKNMKKTLLQQMFV